MIEKVNKFRLDKNHKANPEYAFFKDDSKLLIIIRDPNVSS